MPDEPRGNSEASSAGGGVTALLFFAALLTIWGWLFHILSGEWEANSQYSYGWFIPLLAAWIFWQRWVTRPPAHPAGGVLRTASIAVLAALAVPSALGILIAGTYPDWRMVLWGLGLAALVASMALAALAGGWPWVRHLSFAWVFALVSVPWPTQPERWLTRELSLFAAKFAAACLPLAGVAAVCHGTSIDVGTDVLGVDDACSGIRSFQSGIMAALFLGELFGLRWMGRVFLIVAGLAAAYALNIARMILLSLAVAHGGSGVLEKFHDPAGFAILLVTMGGLWALCWILQKMPGTLQSATAEERRGIGRITRTSAFACFAVIGFMAFMVAGAEGWYAWKARNISRAPAWTILPAGPDDGIRDEEIDKRVKDVLHYDRGFQRAWHDAQGHQWHLIFTEWAPGRMSLHYAQPHLPEQCQTMLGRTIISKSELRKMEIHGITIAYNIYKIRAGRDEFCLMYVVNDDRIGGEEILIERPTPANRLKAVLAGRRNMGQRSIQLALIGENDETRAEQAMLKLIPQLVEPLVNHN